MAFFARSKTSHLELRNFFVTVTVIIVFIDFPSERRKKTFECDNELCLSMNYV